MRPSAMSEVRFKGGQSNSNIQAFETIRSQYAREDIKGAHHTYNFVMDTYLREMLPAECGETLGFTLRK